MTWESVNASHKIALNGKTIYEFIDGTHPIGGPFFWVESPQALVRFTEMKLERR